ncbi:uncharacterized protein LOC125313463 isoform X2 [Rhodamnia argentea]|uniref:Uncharacterized protein LOC125313370 isoform X2 n=1 Tax=Rhodamnia argentea TaxID=178133 RepID=A0ABM3GXK4_9MYRT|nr:uncharacterized protein LOC125313370 isoform X2 [Rhodamnia argentea]XP_048129158.1 uncharacterized protein LOC125313463 isoform X2 [Rhodamnia argentea]
MFQKFPPFVKIWKSVIFWLPIPIALCGVFLTCDVFLRRSYCDAAEPWQLGSQDAATPMMQGIIHLPGDITCISFSLVLRFFLPFFLTLCQWRFYYFPQTGFGKSTTTLEIIGTIFTRIFLVLMLIRNSHEVTHCAGSWEASSANHNVPPGGEGTSGANSGWTSILGSSAGENSEPSVNQPTPTCSSNQNMASPSSAPIEQPAPQHTPFPFLQEEGERGDLLRSLHRLVASQLKHSFERDLPRWRLSSTTELYDASAYRIMIYDMGISIPEDTKEDIKEWIHEVRSNPELLKSSYNDFKKGSYLV